MSVSTSDRLNALFKPAPKPAVHASEPRLPHLSTMSMKTSLAPDIYINEIKEEVVSSSWSISSAGSTPPSIIDGKGKRQSKGLRSMFSRNKMTSTPSHSKPEIIEEEEANAPMPSHEELHRALELTALELQEDISKSSTEPLSPPISMNPFISYIATPPTEIEDAALKETLDKNLAAVSASETSDNLTLHSIIAKAKRMSINSVRPSSATSTISSPASPMPPTQVPPTKKRSSIFPQRSNRPGSNASSKPEMTTDGQEFIKVLKEAKKHSTLSTSKLSSESIITMSKWKEGEVMSPAYLDLGIKKSEKAKMKLKKQINDVINKSGWTSKIYILTAGSLSSPPYILQFAPTGPASRIAERTLQVTKQSRAFVTDAIPGRHWVLQISQLLDTIVPNSDMKKPGSRKIFRPSEKVEQLASMLLVLDSGDDMEEWLTALRHEIDVLGGKGKHVEAVAEVPTEKVLENKMERDEKPYPTSSLSHESNLTRRDQPTSESDRGSWSCASQRQSASYPVRPSVDAASSTLSSPEDRKLESLRYSGQSRQTYDNAPLTPASSNHSPAQSFSSSPTFLFDDSPPETEDDKAAHSGLQYKATRQPPGIQTDIDILRSNSKAVAERRRSYQTQATSPLVTEISRPSTASAETSPVNDVALPRKRSLRFPPTAFENGAHLSVVPDQPSPPSFESRPMPEANPSQLDLADEEESRDTFPSHEMEEEMDMKIETIPEIPMRSNRRQSLQTRIKLDLVPEVAALTSADPPISPSVFEKRVSRAGSAGSGVKIQFWGPPPSQPHSRTASQEERLDTLTAMAAPSIQSQMRSMKPPRSRASLGRSNLFDLETHLAAVSPSLPPSDTERYSFATSDSAYSDDSFADADFNPNSSPSMVPLPLAPLNPPDMYSPIARANAKALSQRAERAAKRDSWGAAQRNSVHKPTFRRDSRTERVFSTRAPPKPLSARGFINLAATTAPGEEVITMMKTGSGMTRLKRSASDAANESPKEYIRPATHRASTVPSIPVHIGSMMATSAQIMRKNSLPGRSPGLGRMEEHLAQYPTANAQTNVPAFGPMLPPPNGALPSVPSRKMV